MGSAGKAGWHDVRVIDHGDAVEVRGPKSPILAFCAMLAVLGVAVFAGVAQGEPGEIELGGVLFVIGWTAMMVVALVSACRVAITGDASGLTVGTVRRR